jgi:hypothetical protein
MRRASVLILVLMMMACQRTGSGGTSTEPDGAGAFKGALPKIHYRSEAGKRADALHKKLQDDLAREQMEKASKLGLPIAKPVEVEADVPVLPAAKLPVEATEPVEVGKVNAKLHTLPDPTELQAVKQPLKENILSKKRQLPASIKNLLQAISENEMIKAEKILGSIKGQIDAGAFKNSDIFLVKLLETFIYHRLGELDEVHDIMKENMIYINESRSIRIPVITTVDPRRPISEGVYRKLLDPTYKRGEIMHLYLELSNYVQTKEEGGLYMIALKTDLTLRDEQGRFVHDMNHKVGSKNRKLEKIYNDNLKKNSNRNRREMIYQYFKIPIPTNINPGKYKMEIEIFDLNDKENRSDKKSISFVVR